MVLNPGPRRGELLTIAVSGDYGKPRPALVIQSDAFSQLPSVTVLRISSELHEWPLLRITVQPTETNGLRKPSQIMIDKAVTVPRSKLGLASVDWMPTPCARSSAPCRRSWVSTRLRHEAVDRTSARRNSG